MKKLNTIKKIFTFTLISGMFFSFYQINTLALTTESDSEVVNVEQREASVRALQTITYELDGGTNNSSNPSSYNVGTGVASFHPATKSMNSFVGWFDAAVGGNQITSIAPDFDQPITLFAHWMPIGGPTTFTITYDLNTGTGNVVDTNDYVAGDNAVIKDITGAQNPGNTFVEWNSAADGSGVSYAPNSTITINENVTLFAIWTPVVAPETFTVTYDANTGNGSVVDLNEYLAFDNAIVKDGSSLSKVGYTFTSWNTSADGTGTSYAANSTLSINSDITLYAQWKLNETTPVTPSEVTPKLPQTGTSANVLGLLSVVGILSVLKRKF